MIDTTKKVAVLELYCNGVNMTKTIDSVQKHNETLLDNIELLLQAGAVKLPELNYLACVTGPGSFTGIRVGMATAKAFSVAHKLPLLAGSVFDVIADFVQNGVAVLHSTANSFYTATIKDSKVAKTSVVEREEKEAFFAKNKEIFCLMEEEKHFEEASELQLISNYNFLMYQFFKNQALENNIIESSNFEPYYIQLSQAERQLKEKQKKETKAKK